MAKLYLDIENERGWVQMKKETKMDERKAWYAMANQILAESYARMYGLCWKLDKLEEEGKIDRQTCCDMKRKLPSRMGYAWPLTPAGMQSRYEFCKKEAEKITKSVEPKVSVCRKSVLVGDDTVVATWDIWQRDKSVGITLNEWPKHGFNSVYHKVVDISEDGKTVTVESGHLTDNNGIFVSNNDRLELSPVDLVKWCRFVKSVEPIVGETKLWTKAPERGNYAEYNDRVFTVHSVDHCKQVVTLKDSGGHCYFETFDSFRQKFKKSEKKPESEIVKTAKELWNNKYIREWFNELKLEGEKLQKYWSRSNIPKDILVYFLRRKESNGPCYVVDNVSRRGIGLLNGGVVEWQDIEDWECRKGTDSQFQECKGA